MSSVSGQKTVYGSKRLYTWPAGKDTLSWPETILPGSIQWKVNGERKNIDFVLLENQIIPSWGASSYVSDTIQIQFEVLPYAFHQTITLWDSSQIEIAEGNIIYDPIHSSSRRNLFESPELQYNGGLTRGFSLGNQQSLVFDSELNLQLNGNIGDGYNVKAGITDNNIPIQADGSTRQLQEFDKVFIQIDKDRNSILAGDFDAMNPQGYFMRFNRKLKGVKYSYHDADLQDEWSIKTSAAVSRGVFIRQIITPTEGNQGPYPLAGENGELNIIVLAGSEKVYLDGVLLIRGEDADYILDYNLSELIFTRQRLINIRHRITIEFEYAQNQFQKSQTTFETRYQRDKLHSYFHFYQEKDSKSVTGNLALTSEDISYLSQAGDQEEPFYKSGIQENPVAFNSNQILYTAKDTLTDNTLYKDILKWSTHPGDENLIVTFSEVGPGKGDYVIYENPSPNGRVYSWISPDPVTGMSRGNFSPVILLQAPQQKQMMTVGGGYALGKRGKLTSEIGLSRLDLNRYSSIDDDDNTGFGIKLGYTDKFLLGKDWAVTPHISYESTGTPFRILDPYRNPEFMRDWSLSPNLSSGKEQLPGAGIIIGKGNSIFAQYIYEGYERKGIYNGYRHTGHVRIDTMGWKVEAILGLLQSEDSYSMSKFIRPTLTLERTIRKTGNWRAGITHFLEKNENRLILTDSLSPLSFVQHELSFYFQNNPEDLTHILVSYTQERPKIPINNELILAEIANEWNVSGHMYAWKEFKIDYILRHREVTPEYNPAAIRTRNLLGRIDLKTDLWNKTIKWSAGYEIGNGQEPKAEYKYIKVQQGEGIYVWVDDGDGIEEINEFEQAPFSDEGEYVKLNVFNSNFIRTNALRIQQSILANLKQLKGTGWISKVSLLTTYQMNRKTMEHPDSPYWNPFYDQYPDSVVINSSDTWRSIFYWNRASPAYDVQLSFIQQHFQTLQVAGYEAKESQDVIVRCRVNLRKKLDLVLNLRNGQRSNRSEFFTAKTYSIEQIEAGPELNAVFKDRFRLTSVYQHLFQQNNSGAERYHSDKLSVDGVCRMSNKTDLRATISFVKVLYLSSGNANIDFTVLQGLQPGVNILWSAQWNTRLNDAITLTMQYHGRKTGDIKTVHTGNAQVRANF